jgi:small subunit ribosomal protein S7
MAGTDSAVTVKKRDQVMSRRHRAEKREVIEDAKFGDVVLAKFMNSIMYDGKKSVAEAIVYGALDQVEVKAKSDPLAVFKQALDNVAPAIEVRSRRVGGATYQVPVEVRTERRQALAIRWIITAARARNDKTMVDRLSAELLDASNNRGAAVKKREDTHRMAEANRAFSHYRW